MFDPATKIQFDIAVLKKRQYIYAALAIGALIVLLIRNAAAAFGSAQYPNAWFGLAMIGLWVTGLYMVSDCRGEISRHRLWLSNLQNSAGRAL